MHTCKKMEVKGIVQCESPGERLSDWAWQAYVVGLAQYIQIHHGCMSICKWRVRSVIRNPPTDRMFGGSTLRIMKPANRRRKARQGGVMVWATASEGQNVHTMRTNERIV